MDNETKDKSGNFVETVQGCVKEAAEFKQALEILQQSHPGIVNELALRDSDITRTGPAWDPAEHLTREFLHRCAKQKLPIGKQR